MGAAVGFAGPQHGEGGTLALMALEQRTLGKRAGVVVLCGIISAALFYGDGMITPALSVLSAMRALPMTPPTISRFRPGGWSRSARR